jgi:pimeloyl-ACP methyl ester carboxylesterase
VQFSRDPEALNQFFRQVVPNTGPYDPQVNTDAVSALFDKIGPGILFTHSQSGGLGWRTALKNENVRAIVSFEPAFDFPFPQGDVPPPLTFGGRRLSALTVNDAEFARFTKIPIVIYYGDNIPENPSANPGQEQWRIFFEMAKRRRDIVNRDGGDVTVVHLPEMGIRGNTHFAMSDLNNVQIADPVSKFLSEKKLD